jgi:hypothetical protein
MDKSGYSEEKGYDDFPEEKSLQTYDASPMGKSLQT